MLKPFSINVPEARLSQLPANLWRLRWAIETKDGDLVRSSWTPETRYPSMRKILAEFHGRVLQISIEAQHLFEPKRGREVFARFSGDYVAGLSYKVMVSATTGRQCVVGIEVEDLEGTRHLILRDGTCYSENASRALRESCR